MTRPLEVPVDELEEMAYNSRAVISFGPTRAYLTLPDGRRYAAMRGPLTPGYEPVTPPRQPEPAVRV